MNKFSFPGGERHIRLDGKDLWAIKRFNLWSSDSIFDMLLDVDANKREHQARLWCSNLKACIPYLPYARQDRVSNSGEPLSIAVMADIINSMYLSEIIVWDPHSNVSSALIKNLRIKTQSSLILNGISDLHLYKGIVAPDIGATKKAEKLAEHIGRPIVQGHKQRNTKTGRIESYSILNRITPGRYLVVDDICDGGSTFNMLANAIRQQCMCNGIELDLYVTHGIFSKGTEELFQNYSRIFCANIKDNKKSSNINVLYKENQLLL